MNHGIRRALSLSALALMLAVTLSACGTASDEAEPTVTRIAVEGAPPARTATVPGDATPMPDASPETPDEGDEPTEGGDGGAHAATVELEMVDIEFKPVDFTIPANSDVTVNLTNGGNLPHAFQLEDGSVASDEIAGGGTGSVTLNLAPGEYPYICPVPGHADSGMVGTITAE